MRKGIRNTLFFMTAGIFAGICTACGTSGGEENKIELVQEEEVAGYTTAVVGYGEVVQTAKIELVYTPTEYEKLAFGSEGRLIETVTVKKGDIVTKGDLLAAARVEDLEDSMEELEYQIAHQTMELEHAKELKAFDIEKENILFDQASKTEEAKEEHEETLQDLEDEYHDRIQNLEDSISLNKKRLQQYEEEWEGGRLVAGISGEITSMQQGLQDTYSEKDETVITISNTDSCYFIADDVVYADFFSEGEVYNLTYRANATDVQMEVEPVNRESWEEQMYFKPVNTEILTQGQSGTITIEMGRKENVLCVPVKAIHDAEDGKFVYVMENELLTMRYVEVGLEGAEMTEIISGLEQGETVALK